MSRKKSDFVTHQLIISLILIFFGVLYASTLCAQALKGKLESALSSLPHPHSVNDFSTISHFPSMNQDSTLVCWSFATSSFVESEMKRLGREPVRLSVMFPVYYEFVEKAKRFIQSHGASRFYPGDIFSGVIDVMQQYGAVPVDVYEGRQSEYKIFNHHALYKELDSIASRTRSLGDWAGESFLANVITVLNAHLGVPPKKFTYNGREYSPCTFFSDVVCLPFDEYLFVTSFRYAPFFQYIELKVPDNWNHNNRYFNVPLDIFYRSMTNAVTHGYSVAIDMDNSEQSYRMTKQYAFIPDYDVPKDSITQTKREELFQSGETTDDHLMHIVSHKAFGTENWFLAKDSWRTAWEGPNHGYFYLHESYIKLKVLAFLVHRSAVPEIVELRSP